MAGEDKYEQFKNSPFYTMISDQMKVASAMYFCDPEKKGMTFTEIKDKIDSSIQETDAALELLVIGMSVEPIDKEKDGRFEKAYILDQGMTEGMDALAGSLRLL